MGEAERYRIWVLEHWKFGSWSIPGLKMESAKARTAISKLVKDGLMRQSESGMMYQISDAGRAALTQEREQ